MKITFDESAKLFILDTFDLSYDQEGYIVEKHDPRKYVLNKNSQKIHIDDFEGISPNREIIERKTS